VKKMQVLFGVLLVVAMLATVALPAAAQAPAPVTAADLDAAMKQIDALVAPLAAKDPNVDAKAIVSAIKSNLYKSFKVMPTWRAAGKDPKDMTILVVPKSVGHPYWADVEKGVKKAGDEIGCKAIFSGPTQADTNQQISLIEDYMSTGVDGLAISANDPTAVMPIIRKALDAGVPTLMFDADSPNSDRLMYIGTDNVVGGKMLGDEVVKRLNGEGKVQLITAGLAALNLNQRMDGMREAAKGTKIELLGPEAHNENLDVAYNIVENVVTAHPDLKAIYMTSGVHVAAKALKDMGKKPGEIMLFGFDVFDPQPQLIRDGWITAVVSQRPMLMGELSVKWLVDFNLGKKTPPASGILDTGTILVTKDNLDEYLTAPH
jgi:ribose transport system substrate-binding protein